MSYDALPCGVLIPSSMAYEGATQGHRFDDIPEYAPEDVLGSVETLRARAQHYSRNNPWAENATKSWVASAIGNGIKPHWQLKDEKLRKAIHEVYTDWTEESDYDEQLSFYGQQALLFRTVIDSGSALAVKRPRPLSDGLSVPVQVQILEPSMLASDLSDEDYQDGSYFRSGIKYAKNGKKNAYRLYKKNPNAADVKGDPNETVWLDKKDVAHVFDVTRPGIQGGAPWVASCLLRIRELDQYEDAELVRKKTAALFTAFVYESTGQSGVKLTKRSNKKIREMHPGLVKYLNSNEEVKFSQPADVGTTYEPWLRYQLLSIAKSYGITYEMLTGDLRNVNYSSIRAGLLEFERLCKQVQYHMIVHQFCRVVLRWFMDSAVLHDRFDVKLTDYTNNPRAYLRVTWQTPRREEVDPLKKVMADVMEVRAGFDKLSHKQSDRGNDPEMMLDYIQELNGSLDDYNIILDSDPRKVNKSGAEQSSLSQVMNND